MQTLFELKTDIKLPYDEKIFEKMKETALNLLNNEEKDEYTQAIVLFSATANEYGITVKNAMSKEKTEEAALLEKLKAASDTEIDYVLCMWQDKNIDIPSYSFREMLCELDKKNAECLIFVMTADGIGAVKLVSTMK